MNEGGKSNYEIMVYEGMGHLVDLPYDPPCYVTNHVAFPKPLRMLMGGAMRQRHAHAQEKAWQDSLRFFTQSLCDQQSQ